MADIIWINYYKKKTQNVDSKMTLRNIRHAFCKYYLELNVEGFILTEHYSLFSDYKGVYR